MSKDFSYNSRLSRREAICGLAMLGAGGVAAARKPSIKIDYMGAHKLDAIVPTRIGKWNFVSSSGLIVPPQDQLALALYSQLLTRIYWDGEAAVMLLIAYSASQTGFLQVHRPEFCYTAAGYQLSDFAHRNIQLGSEKSIQVNTLTATRDGQNEKLLYWTRIGNHIPLSWPQQKLVFAEDNLKRLIPDAALVRISTTATEGQAGQILDRFVQSMVASVQPDLRRVFIA